MREKINTIANTIKYVSVLASNIADFISNLPLWEDYKKGSSDDG